MLVISVDDRKKIYQFLALHCFICPHLQIHTASEPTATIASKPFWFTWPKARCRKQPWIRAALVADWPDTSLYLPRWPSSQKILCHILFKGIGKMKGNFHTVYVRAGFISIVAVRPTASNTGSIAIAIV